MNKIDCYKCNRESSVECGKCPVWLANEKVSKKERIAYRIAHQQGAKEFAEWLVDKGILGNRCIYNGEITDYGKVYLAEWQKGRMNELEHVVSCGECKQIDTCKDKIDVRVIEDDIKYGFIVPNYIPGPNAECLVEGEE